MDNTELTRLKRRVCDLEGVKFKTQYSSDGVYWHTAFSDADIYIRFSADSGASWSDTALFKGTKGAVYPLTE